MKYSCGWRPGKEVCPVLWDELEKIVIVKGACKIFGVRQTTLPDVYACQALPKTKSILDSPNHPLGFWI